MGSSNCSPTKPVKPCPKLPSKRFRTVGRCRTAPGVSCRPTAHRVRNTTMTAKPKSANCANNPTKTPPSSVKPIWKSTVITDKTPVGVKRSNPCSPPRNPPTVGKSLGTSSSPVLLWAWWATLFGGARRRRPVSKTKQGFQHHTLAAFYPRRLAFTQHHTYTHHHHHHSSVLYTCIVLYYTIFCMANRQLFFLSTSKTLFRIGGLN